MGASGLMTMCWKHRQGLGEVEKSRCKKKSELTSESAKESRRFRMMEVMEGLKMITAARRSREASSEGRRRREETRT